MNERRPKWWQFPWREIASFTLGATILLEQTVGEEQPKAILVGAALALMGVTGVGSARRAILRALDGGEKSGGAE